MITVVGAFIVVLIFIFRDPDYYTWIQSAPLMKKYLVEVSIKKYLCNFKGYVEDLCWFLVDHPFIQLPIIIIWRFTSPTPYVQFMSFWLGFPLPFQGSGMKWPKPRAICIFSLATVVDLDLALRPIRADEMKSSFCWNWFPIEFETGKTRLGGTVVILHRTGFSVWDKANVERSRPRNQRKTSLFEHLIKSCLKDAVWMGRNRWKNRGAELSSLSHSLTRESICYPFESDDVRAITWKSHCGEPSSSSIIWSKMEECGGGCCCCLCAFNKS